MEPVDWQVNRASLECAKYMLEHQVKCDVNFKVGDKEEIIKAHKFILTMRSPVFDRMFNGSFCESEKDPVVPDVSPAAFRILLRYCYYECLDIEGGAALSVLYAATKYMLPILERAARKTLIAKLDHTRIWPACKYSTEVGDKKLQLGCSTYFKKNLSGSNILDVIRYAVSVGDKELHACCKNYLRKHLSGTNIWVVYKYALNEGDADVHQYCREYFQKDIVTVREALQSEKFSNIPYAVLSDILHINDETDKASGANYKSENTMGISISDIELFKACNTWAEVECQRQEIDPSGANKRIVLRECLFLIQFPTMLQKDILTVVHPTDILTQSEIINLAQYKHRDPGSEGQVDFTSGKRQFVVTPSGPTSGKMSTGPVYIESEVRVMLSKLWTLYQGSYRVSVRDEGSQRSWSMVLKTKHENHLVGDSDYILHYIDIEPPQVLEAGTRYSVTAEGTQGGTLMYQQPGVEYIRIYHKYSPYNEVKITQNTSPYIRFLTLSLV